MSRKFLQQQKSQLRDHSRAGSAYFSRMLFNNALGTSDRPSLAQLFERVDNRSAATVGALVVKPSQCRNLPSGICGIVIEVQSKVIGKLHPVVQERPEGALLPRRRHHRDDEARTHIGRSALCPYGPCFIDVSTREFWSGSSSHPQSLPSFDGKIWAMHCSNRDIPERGALGFKPGLTQRFSG